MHRIIPRCHTLPAPVLRRRAVGGLTVPRRRLLSTSQEAQGSPSETLRPRAVGIEMGKRRKGYVKWVIVSGLGAGALFIAYQHEFSWKIFQNRVQNFMRALTDPETGDPAIEDLQRALGPAPPQGYLSVMIAAEDVLVHREWNRSYGWLYEPRAGLKDLLRHLVDPSNPVMVTLWSENNSNVAAEMTEKLMHEVGGPPAHTPPLSVEHMFLRAATGSTAAPGSKRKEKRLEYFNRDRQSMLLIDKDPVSEQLNPHNTILVTAMGAGAAGNAGADTTCAAIRAVVQRVRDDAALSGIVNVPRTLHNLRQEAVAAGYSTDAAGLHMYLVASAEEEVERERQRREAGLGGLMRRAAATNPILKSKMTTNEAAMLRDFRDPAIELGPDALLASKVREATQKMFQR